MFAITLTPITPITVSIGCFHTCESHYSQVCKCKEALPGHGGSRGELVEVSVLPCKVLFTNVGLLSILVVE